MMVKAGTGSGQSLAVYTGPSGPSNLGSSGMIVMGTGAALQIPPPWWFHDCQTRTVALTAPHGLLALGAAACRPRDGQGYEARHRGRCYDGPGRPCPGIGR